MKHLLATAALALALAGSLPAPARANPPRPGSHDYEIMHQFSDWVTDRHRLDADGHKYWCCDFSDGRPLDDDELRMAGDHWQFLFTKRHWDNGDDQWHDIPNDHLLREFNPVGYPIVWATRDYDGSAKVYCAIVGGGV